MARTQSSDYDQKREAITKQAAKIFGHYGFAGASISELASQCNVSKSLIYHYYGSKEEILYGVMNDHINDLIESLDNIPEHSKPQDEMSEVSRKLLQNYIGAAQSQKVLLYELNSLPKENRKEIVAKQRIIIARIEDILIRCQPLMLKNRAHLRAKVMLYFGMLNWTHSWFNPSGPVSRDELADMAAHATLNSLE